MQFILDTKSFLYFIIVFGILAVLPLFFMIFDLAFAANTLFIILLYSIMAFAWNLLGGYGGQISFGHAVFFGVGAYVTTSLLLFYEITPWIGIFVGGLVAALTGLGLSVPFFRLRSHWFSLATLASVTIFLLAFQELAPGQAAGLQIPIVPPEKQLYYIRFPEVYPYIYIALMILILEIMILYYFVKSRIGYYLQAIRENEEAAMAMGINPFKYKMIAMTISTFFMGIAGGIYTVRFRFVDPYSVFDLILISIYPVIISLLGGMYYFWGPFIGSFVFLPLFEYARSNIVSTFPRYFGLHYLIAGIILLIISLWLPQGILGWLEKKGYIKKVVKFNINTQKEK
ncbi:MAG: branched-chain amino acid ABC transporter permease [Thermoprotei archaeon]